MKKIANIMIFLVVFLTSFSSANAQPAFSMLNSAGSADGVIFTLLFTGTDQTEVNGFQVYAGNSTSGHCSADTMLQHVQYWGGDPLAYPIEINNTWIFYNADIHHLIGSGKGCIKINLLTNNKTYSSGDIQLGWNPAKERYTSAVPNALQVHML